MIIGTQGPLSPVTGVKLATTEVNKRGNNEIQMDFRFMLQICKLGYVLTGYTSVTCLMESLMWESSVATAALLELKQ